MNKLSTIIAVVLLLMCSGVMAKPLKVYIMAGQSNMQGHARIKTFDHIGMDPKTAPMLKKMTNEDGSPKIFDDIWISTLGCARTAVSGKMTAKYGADRAGPKIGPEFTFGIYMQEFVKEPILIIKTAWGGKTLSNDFRPPSAGPYRGGQDQPDKSEESMAAVKKVEEMRNETTGHYYRLMMGHIKKVLADIKSVYPDYDASQGCEVASFMWLQGCNDFGDYTTYPNAGKPGGYDEYSRLMATFIKDVRRELNAPKMPFVIGVLGIKGDVSNDTEDKEVPMLISFRKAMAAPSNMPEFKGNVAAVHTEKFWEPKLYELQSRWVRVKAKSNELKKQGLGRSEQKAVMDEFLKTVYNPQEWELMEKGVSNAAYHYMGSAKIMARIGKAFTEAINDMDDK